MASQTAVHALSVLKGKTHLQQLQLSVYAQKLMLHQLRKQENNHAATSTQKIS
jgi:hypothetical protein